MAPQIEYCAHYVLIIKCFRAEPERQVTQLPPAVNHAAAHSDEKVDKRILRKRGLTLKLYDQEAVHQNHSTTQAGLQAKLLCNDRTKAPNTSEVHQHSRPHRHYHTHSIIAYGPCR